MDELVRMGVAGVRFGDHAQQHSLRTITVTLAPGFKVDDVSNEIQQQLVAKDMYMCALCMQPFVSAHVRFDAE